VTVEDPSVPFQSMRDYFDTIQILKMGFLPEMIPLNLEKGKLFL